VPQNKEVDTTMDNLLKELFGGDDDDAPAATAAAPSASAATADREAERAARRAARQARKADPERQRKRKEFADRYTTGDPSEGFTTVEALEHIQDMRQEMTPAEFREAMKQTIEHLPPDKRDDFIAFMRKQRAAMGQAAPAAAAQASAPAAGTVSADPFAGLLGGLLGGGGTASSSGGFDAGSVLDDLMKGGLSAPATATGGQPTEADFQTLLNSPLARAVLGGLATYGMQAMQSDRDDHDTPSRG
jgi:hypothetical protein